MDIKIDVKDYTDKIIADLERKAVVFLEEAKNSVASQASLNSPIDTGNLSRSFGTDSFVDENKKVAYIGSSLKYSIYQEYGTGEYALEGNGRKGGWVYKSEKDGKFYKTNGVKPQRMLYRAMKTKKPLILSQAKKILGSVSKNG